MSNIQYSSFEEGQQKKRGGGFRVGRDLWARRLFHSVPIGYRTTRRSSLQWQRASQGGVFWRVSHWMALGSGGTALGERSYGRIPGQTHQKVPQIAQRQQSCNAEVASGANVRKRRRRISLHGACIGSPKLMFRAFREVPTPWRPHSGCRVGVCASFASLATLALNGSENFDAFALGRIFVSLTRSACQLTDG